jgi:hypothetical protein
MAARALLLVAAGAALVASGDAVVVGTCPTVVANASIQCYNTPNSAPGPFSGMNVAGSTTTAPIGGMCYSGVVALADGTSVYLQGAFASPVACQGGLMYLQAVVPANATATATFCTRGNLCNVMVAPAASSAAGAATTAALVLAAAAAAMVI